jgi:hypothetical protein
MRTIFFVAVQLLLLTGFADAQSAANVVKEFGLVGSWAIDCRQPPSPTNAYANFSLTSGGAIELRDDFGPDFDDMIYRIVDAKRIGQFRLSLRQLLTTDDQIVLDTVMLRAGGRIRNWSSRLADGSSVLVENGIIPLAREQETGWMTRCDVRAAGRGISAPITLGLR